MVGDVRVACDLFPFVTTAAPLAHLRAPSPLEEERQLGLALGIDLWVKREDLLDDSGAGHKVRKLGYLISEAHRHSATVLVTAASPPSSQAVAVALHAPLNGMRAHVVYCGDDMEERATPMGNQLLVEILGPTITWARGVGWGEWPMALAKVIASERAAGELPWVAPPGLSAWPGMLGSIDLGLELDAQLDDPGRPVDIIVSAGSGGTCLGIAAVAELLERPWAIHGVCVAGAAAVGAELRELSEALEKRTGLRVPEERIHLHEAPGSPKYAAPVPEELDALVWCARSGGLLVDPTYMARTVGGLLRLVEAGVVLPRTRVVLVHTGGVNGLFNGDRALASYMAERSAGGWGGGG